MDSFYVHFVAAVAHVFADYVDVVDVAVVAAPFGDGGSIVYEVSPVADEATALAFWEGCLAHFERYWDRSVWDGAAYDIFEAPSA